MEMQKKCKIYICFLIDFICPDSTLLILVPFFQSANVTPHFQCGVIRLLWSHGGFALGTKRGGIVGLDFSMGQK